MNIDSPNLARQLFAASGIASQVAPATLDALLAQANVRTYAQGRVLCLRGDPITELHFILTGSIEMSIEDADGNRAVCFYVGPGQWLGLVPILDGRGSVHTLRAHAETLALCLSRQTFLTALAQDPGLTTLCLNVLCERSRAIYAHLAAGALLSLRARIARLLLMLLEQHGGQSGVGGSEVGLKLTQDDFAAMLGISRQSLNRELRALEAEGVIALAYSRINLCDIAALRVAAATTFE